ncbi:MAG: hypothetical protein OIF50_00730 [Flavobacteriaceae bacterium]|nr:hypothetical protein [Flavobacteriaceae bacterium]
MIQRFLFFLFFIWTGTVLQAQRMALKSDTLVFETVKTDSIEASYSYYYPSQAKAKRQDVLVVHISKADAKKWMAYFRKVATAQGMLLFGNHNVDAKEHFVAQSEKYNLAIRDFSSRYALSTRSIYFVGIKQSCGFVQQMSYSLRRLAGVLLVNPQELLPQKTTLKNEMLRHVVLSSDNNYYSYGAQFAASNMKLKIPPQFYWYPATDSIVPLTYMLFSIDQMSRKLPEQNLSPTDSLVMQKRLGHLEAYIKQLKTDKRYLEALEALQLMQDTYKPYMSRSYLKERIKTFKRSGALKTALNQYFKAQSKAQLLQEDYSYYFDEDMYRYNFENLGWWNYQMSELLKFEQGEDLYLKRMGVLLRGELLLRIDQQIPIVENRRPLDDKLLDLLLMLKTVVYPDSYQAYLRIISMSSQREDFGTALFYTEELLKNGFKDYQQMYTIPKTTFLKLSPEFNDIVRSYFGKSRY